MEQVQILVMDFIDSEGKRFSLKVPDPRIDLDPEEVESVMNLIIEKNIFARPALVSIEKAYIQTTTQDIIVFGA